MNGVLIVNKPKGKTSFDMIRDVRKEYGTKKVGHIGTLDPLAEGVLPVLIGECTKLSDYLMNHDKEYIAELKLGKRTSTGDSEGEVIEEKEIKDLNEEEIINVLNSFLGKTEQLPPMYSAIKINGKKLYDYARNGEEEKVKELIKPREIEITEIVLLEFNKEENIIKYRVVCSKGTYIRVLCEDIAIKLETCGYMKSLLRTRVGKFKIEDENKVIDIENILENRIDIKNSDLFKLLNGVKLEIKENNDLYNIYCDDKYIGIGEVVNNKLKRKIII